MPTSEAQLEVIGWQLKALNEKFERLEKQQSEMKNEIDGIRDAANRWKGGFIVILAIGSVIGWLTSLGGNIARFFHS